MPERETKGQGGDFDQKQKFEAKLPNPRDKISIHLKFPTLWK